MVFFLVERNLKLMFLSLYYLWPSGCDVQLEIFFLFSVYEWDKSLVINLDKTFNCHSAKMLAAAEIEGYLLNSKLVA